MCHSFSQNFHTSQTPFTQMSQRTSTFSSSIHSHNISYTEEWARASLWRITLIPRQSKPSIQTGKSRCPDEILTQGYGLSAWRGQWSKKKKFFKTPESWNWTRTANNLVSSTSSMKEGTRKRNELATLGIDKVRKRALTMESDHDINWHSQEYTKELQLHKEFLKKVHWIKITGQLKNEQDKSNLHKKIHLVLPHFHCKDVAKATTLVLKIPSRATTSTLASTWRSSRPSLHWRRRTPSRVITSWRIWLSWRGKSCSSRWTNHCKLQE